MVHKHAVLEVLAAVHKVQSVEADVGAGSGEVRVDVDPHGVATKRDNHVLKRCVTGRPNAVRGRVHAIAIPLVNCDNGELRALARLNLYCLIKECGSVMKDHNRALRHGLSLDDNAPGLQFRTCRDSDVDGLIQLDLSGDDDLCRLLKLFPRQSSQVVTGR